MTGLLGIVDIFLDGKLHDFHHKVRAIGYSNSIAVGKEVVHNFCQRVCATWLAMRRRLAVGRPRGQSLVGSTGSLCRQNM